jgi:hypothetical protein
MKKPNNEVERWATRYNCGECDGPIVGIRGEFSCTTDCCRTSTYYYWCDNCGDEKELKYDEMYEF